MKEFKRPNVLFSSSATVYGDAEVLPVTEQTPRQPATSPYGNTKQIAEDILHDCCRAYEGFYGIALRYFNPIGAHPSAPLTAPAYATTSTLSTLPRPTWQP